jgi:hypothetical protein
MAKRFTLTTEQKTRLTVLAKLGVSITPSDAAKILDVPEDRLQAYLATPAGHKLWSKHRAEGRAELLAVLRRLALEGSPQAQKLFASFIAADDTRRPADQRLTGPELRAMIGRSAEALNKRARAGDWIHAGADRRFALGDVVGLIPKLWDKLEAARATIARLEAKTTAAETDRAEAQRLLALEQLRARKRENDIAEGRLIDVQTIRAQTDALLIAVRQAITELGAALTLKLALPDHAVRTVQRETAATLAKLATIMERATHAG